MQLLRPRPLRPICRFCKMHHFLSSLASMPTCSRSQLDLPSVTASSVYSLAAGNRLSSRLVPCIISFMKRKWPWSKPSS